MSVRSHPLEYRTWTAMWSRCTNPKQRHWPSYGGRGIRVCEAWRSFSAFLDDLGPRPSLRHSIERIDNDGNYEPGNCRWATRHEQMRNTRRSRWVEFQGERVLLIVLAERAGLPFNVVWQRLNAGWPLQRAISEPKGPSGGPIRGEPVVVHYRGERMPLYRACQLAKLNYGTVYLRLKAGWSADRALSTKPRKRRIPSSEKK